MTEEGRLMKMERGEDKKIGRQQTGLYCLISKLAERRKEECGIVRHPTD